MADSKERTFQQDIVDALSANGWLVGESGRYDRTRGLYPEDVIAFYQEAHPEQWERFSKHNSHDPETVLLDKTARQLDKTGTLDVLRHGFRVPGAKVTLCAFQPDHGMNEDALARYRANRLRVVPELSYSPHAREGEYDPRLDLVLFVNGIPTATLELKSEFKQAFTKAVQQYRKDRPPKDPLTKKPEPLLTFKRGALVHFAVSQDEVSMTTRLAGDDTTFLPFNRGTADGGAGNPAPETDDAYATDYLWREVFDPDAWLHILGRFLHLQKDKQQDFHGRWTTKESLIFPRYHQWDVVNRLIDATREEGPGHRYLVQHSAGSGKSNSIAWVAHQLAALYDATGGKLFDSVVVVTDRTVLDSQLQDTIYQFEHASGVVRPINRDEGGASKSAQLADALKSKTRIVIVTLQTFPALFEAIGQHKDLSAGTYAVIADEAHSSQTGAAATKLKTILGVDRAEDEAISAEDLVQAAVEARKPNQRISYYAFTATPKARTLELFGRLPDPDRPKGEDNKPEAFHVYAMRQAIEEGFILDVLQNYITYAAAWKLAHPHGGDQEADSRKAAKKLARWVRLHPHNIEQKVQVIVEHFRQNIRPRLDGQAKAMVVTGSRQEAVRYQLATQEYIREQGYDDVHPLVAFSGQVPPDDVIPFEVTETTEQLNPGLKGRDHREAFDTGAFNLMIVANKFQTGFDQPRLCAMYVDRTLKGVDCVQTLSRLNRTFPGKAPPFVLDFVNDPEDVRQAFEPYYTTAQLTDVSDPNTVYDLMGTLNAAQIYEWPEVDHFAQAFFNPRGQASKLTYWCRPAKDRFKAQYDDAVERMQRWRAEKQRAGENGDKNGLQNAEHELKQAGEARDALDTFRKNLATFARNYEFLSQVVDYDDPDLEKLCVFARHLHPLLRPENREDDEIDFAELQLTHYRLAKRAERSLQLGEDQADYGLKPGTEAGTRKPRDPRKERLQEIIERLNELFGAEVDDEDKLQWAQNLADRVRRNDEVMQQARTNTQDQMMRGRYPQVLEQIVIDSMNDHESLATKALETPENMDFLARLVLSLAHQRESEQAAAG